MDKQLENISVDAAPGGTHRVPSAELQVYIIELVNGNHQSLRGLLVMGTTKTSLHKG